MRRMNVRTQALQPVARTLVGAIQQASIANPRVGGNVVVSLLAYGGFAGGYYYPSDASQPDYYAPNLVTNGVTFSNIKATY